MVTKIQKWGNSQGLRLPKGVLEDAQLAVGDEVDVAVQGGAILISPVSRTRGRHRLEDLVDRMPKQARTTEVDRGNPVGKEIW